MEEKKALSVASFLHLESAWLWILLENLARIDEMLLPGIVNERQNEKER